MENNDKNGQTYSMIIIEGGVNLQLKRKGMIRFAEKI